MTRVYYQGVYEAEVPRPESLDNDNVIISSQEDVIHMPRLHCTLRANIMPLTAIKKP